MNSVLVFSWSCLIHDPKEQVNYQQFQWYYNHALEEGGYGQLLPIAINVVDSNVPGAIGFDEDAFSIVSDVSVSLSRPPGQVGFNHKDKNDKGKEKEKESIDEQKQPNNINNNDDKNYNQALF